MSYNTHNYHAHGGEEWVIGGKLTFLPGATVEGAEGLFDGAGSAITPMAYQADSEATTIAQLKESFNALLAGLRTAGFMAAAPTPESTPDPQNTDPETQEGEGS